ncbi:hypothetical protein K438DRAFT_1790829 [Mycena galopus ATCC 62051]|nr:hypothetical protein K438DRAFT_1790829 [Mycena galopus ATCC 62051]
MGKGSEELVWRRKGVPIMDQVVVAARVEIAVLAARLKQNARLIIVQEREGANGPGNLEDSPEEEIHLAEVVPIGADGKKMFGDVIFPVARKEVEIDLGAVKIETRVLARGRSQSRVNDPSRPRVSNSPGYQVLHITDGEELGAEDAMPVGAQHADRPVLIHAWITGSMPRLRQEEICSRGLTEGSRNTIGIRHIRRRCSLAISLSPAWSTYKDPEDGLHQRFGAIPQSTPFDSGSGPNPKSSKILFTF